jgi:hypothetical protein
MVLVHCFFLGGVAFEESGSGVILVVVVLLLLRLEHYSGLLFS